jgi:hypothetical protein
VLAFQHSEKRRSPRFELKTQIRLSWTDHDGHFHFADARCIDVSETGIRVEVAGRLDSTCYINVRAEKLGINNSARVRSLNQKGLKNHVGLEFNGGWRWKALAKYVVGASA